jgi:hypothetical protein
VPLQNIQRGPNAVGDSQATGSVTVTASATINTKGAWTQLEAATAQDHGMLVIQPDDVQVSATNTSTLLDIGVGAAGAELVILPNVNMGGWGHGTLFSAPLFIPEGSRVAVRIASVIASKAFSMRVNFIPCPTMADAAQFCETWGASTATSQGTTLTTPSVAGTKTAWQQISAGITRDTSWIAWSLANAGTNISANKGGFDIGYGGAGAEQPLVQDARWEQLGTEQFRPCHFVVPCNLPAGTRLAVRWDSTGTTAASVANAVVHCFS